MFSCHLLHLDTNMNYFTSSWMSASVFTLIFDFEPGKKWQMKCKYEIYQTSHQNQSANEFDLRIIIVFDFFICSA